MRIRCCATRPFPGIATLKGKSLRERARELIAVAHPDFRGDLAAEARRMYG
jgi:acyl-CoA hydrolase